MATQGLLASDLILYLTRFRPILKTAEQKVFITPLNPKRLKKPKTNIDQLV